jgi:hypothetical protein
VRQFQQDTHFEHLVFNFFFLHLDNSLYLFQDLIKDYNFAQGTHLKLCLKFKWQASKVGTLKQIQDHMTYVILQTYTILTTTTSILLLLLYVYTPPKIFSNFKINLLAGITTNTLQAGSNLEPIPIFTMDQVQPCTPSASMYPSASLPSPASPCLGPA